MKLEGFEEFYFKGTEDQKKELIKIHERNGCLVYSNYTYRFSYVCFEAGRSVGDASDFKRSVDCKTYAGAKAYLLSFAKPVMPDKVAKPKRKKSVAFNQGFVIDGARYTKTHIHGVSVERVKQEIRTLRLKLDRHTRLDKDGALDNR